MNINQDTTVVPACYSFRFVAMACCVEMSSIGQKLYLGLVTQVYNTIQVRDMVVELHHDKVFPGAQVLGGGHSC